MKTTILLFLIAALGLLGMMGCGGGAPAPVISPNDASVDWPIYMNMTPDEPGLSFASATATSNDPQLAIKKASGQATAELAAEIKMLVEDRLRTISDEAGLGDDAQLHTETVVVTENILTEVMKGFNIREKEYHHEGKGYRAFLLMEVPKVLADEALMGAVAKDEEMRARFMASKTFQDLDALFK